VKLAVGQVWKTPSGFARIVGFRVGGAIVVFMPLVKDDAMQVPWLYEAEEMVGYGWRLIGTEDSPAALDGGPDV
jgi:hypothetical protein